MSVRAGREFLAIPGPTTVPDEVLRAMHRPAVEIYSGSLLALTDGLLRDVARVFNTKGRAYIYAANGHGAWEASLTNVLSRGDRILVLESGRFAINWGDHARRMGVEVEVLKGDMRRAVRPAEVEARLKADRTSRSGRTIKAVLSGLRCAARAEEIHVLAGTRDASQPPRLPDLLDEHGVTAKLHVLPISGQQAFGETLLRTAHQLGADMLVMGAFARHPVRSLIIGGVTRHMLAHADLPVLMRH